WRHEGYISKHGILLKWKELGVELNPFGPSFKRLEAAAKDERPKGKICFMCDGDVAASAMVTVPTEKGNVNLCSAHHFFVMLSCLQKDVEATEQAATIADAATGKMIPAMAAIYLCGLEERTGRPAVKAFADRGEAEKARAAEGGSIVGYDVLKQKELAARCGFCDRSVYPEEAALVKIEGVHSWGCCAHCSMGCAARTGKEIEVHQPDGLTGEPVIVKTLGGYVASIEPETAVAWFGKRKNAEGKFASAGCFHQGFFVNEENLRKWVQQRPLETGEAITIEQSLRDKMGLSPAQIQKACKVGECSPK
ncbi:MAG: alkylmercury lyase family protein, partial [Pirellulaceae bacterium]|nr:alkylmercury lyase family protein [Pirellulaceae bacterium]